MILETNVSGTGRTPRPRIGHQLAASIDVEWTKNYKIKNGNVPFCWSVTWLHIPATLVASPPLEFAYCSAYVQTSDETQRGNAELFPLVVVGGLVTIIPLIALFVILQRYWRSGLLPGSLAS